MARKNARQKETSSADTFLFDMRTKAVMAQPSQDGIKNKVAAVREVVPGKSNNEIILVLQYFDNNVEQAIQAYLEDGAEEALKEWHYPNKLNDKKKKKKATKTKTEGATGNHDNAPSETDTKTSSLATDATDRLSEVGSIEDSSSVSTLSFSQPSLGATFNGLSTYTTYTDSTSITSTSDILADLPGISSLSSETQGVPPAVRPTHIPLQNGMVDSATSTEDIVTRTDVKTITDFNHNISVSLPDKSETTTAVKESAVIESAVKESHPVNSQGARPKTNFKNVPNGDSSSNSYKTTRKDNFNSGKHAPGTNSDRPTSGSNMSYKPHGNNSGPKQPQQNPKSASNSSAAKSTRPGPPKHVSNLPNTAISSLISRESGLSMTQQSQQDKRKKQRNQRARRTSQGDKASGGAAAAAPYKTANQQSKKTGSTQGQGQTNSQSSAQETDTTTVNKPPPERSTSIDPALENKIAAVGLERALKDLQRQTTSLQRLKLILDEEVGKAYKSIGHIFEEMRDALNNREAELLFEMDQVRDQGRNVLKKRQNKATELRKRINQSPSMSEKDRAMLKADIKLFVGDRKTDEDLCQTSRFSCHGDRMVKDINSFGEIISIKNSYRQERPSMTSMTSQESTGSSVAPLTPLSVFTPGTTPSTPLSPLSADILASSGGASIPIMSPTLANLPLTVSKENDSQGPKKSIQKQEDVKQLASTNGTTTSDKVPDSAAPSSQPSVKDDASSAVANEQARKQNNRRRRRKAKVIRDGEETAEGSTGERPERPSQNQRNNSNPPHNRNARPLAQKGDSQEMQNTTNDGGAAPLKTPPRRGPSERGPGRNPRQDQRSGENRSFQGQRSGQQSGQQSRYRGQRSRTRSQGTDGYLNKNASGGDNRDNKERVPVKKENVVNGVALGLDGDGKAAGDVQQHSQKPNQASQHRKYDKDNQKITKPNGPKMPPPQHQQQNGQKNKDVNGITAASPEVKTVNKPDHANGPAANKPDHANGPAANKPDHSNGPAVNGSTDNGHISVNNDKKDTMNKEINKDAEAKTAPVKKSVVSVSVKSLDANSTESPPDAPLPQRQPRQRKNDVKRAEVVVNGKFDDEEDAGLR